MYNICFVRPPQFNISLLTLTNAFCGRYHRGTKSDCIIAPLKSFSPHLQINTHSHTLVLHGKTGSHLNGNLLYAGRLKGTNRREGQRRLKESLRTSDGPAPSPAPPSPPARSRTSLETAPSNYLIVGQLLNNVRGWLPSNDVSAARGYNVPVNIHCLSR